MNATVFDKALAKERAVWGEIPPRAPGLDMLEDNGKAGLAVGLAFRTCDPTGACAKTCYAARRALRRPACLRKAIAVTKAIEADPDAAAARIVKEYRRRAPKRGATFLRWNSSGDLFPAAIDCILEVARRGIVVHVFTRKPGAGAALRHAAMTDGFPVVVLLSVDGDNWPEVLDVNFAGCRLAALTSADAPAPFSRLDPARTVAFPVDAKPANIKTVPDKFKAGACPCDMGVRHFSDSCAQCLRDGSGCFMGV